MIGGWKKVEMYFDKLAAFERKAEPCRIAVPFKKGEVTSLDDFVIKNGENSVASQYRVTSSWNDGSVKWGLFDFEADLRANSPEVYSLSVGKPASVEKIKAVNNGECLTIDNGQLVIKLNNKGSIFHSITNGSITYAQEDIQGPIVNDVFCACVTEGFEELYNGGVTAAYQARGRHFDSSGESVLDFVFTIYVFRNKDWFKVDYQIVNTEEVNEYKIISLDWKFKRKTDGKKRLTLGKSNYRTSFEQSDEYVKHIIDADELIYEANEHMSETFYGTFFGDWSDENGGLCATIYQAQQNYPKGIAITDRLLDIMLVPYESDGLCMLRGMAKTHSLFFQLHDGSVTIEDLNYRSLQFQLPDVPYISSEVYRQSGVFPDIFVDKPIDIVEMALIRRMDFRSRAFGILCWGDSPDAHYTDQGRGGGGIVWTNNEYDFPHTAMLMYARTPENRRFLDYLTVAARHWIDVDICHSSADEYRINAQIIHSARHVSGQVEISHEWVEGLLDYYHISGDISAYEAAIGIGNNIKKNLTLPKYHRTGEINARETGWALRALTALYIETNDESWLEDADFIVGHFRQWKEKYGEWLAPYTDHTAIRVPFMISIAIGSLMRYYRIKPDEEIKRMIIDAAEDLVENAMLNNGLFYYKELPSLKRLGNNTLLLEAMVYAYELSGDLKFLRAGKNTFLNYILEASFGGAAYTKKKIEDAVILSGHGSKSAAQSSLPIALYYSAISAADIAKEIMSIL